MPPWSRVSLIGVCNRVRLGVKFVCTVYSASGPMVSVVGDDGSGDPLHERCDESDVYEGEVAQVDVGSGARWVVRWNSFLHSCDIYLKSPKYNI